MNEHLEETVLKGVYLLSCKQNLGHVRDGITRKTSPSL
jgi:hypothetical protein